MSAKALTDSGALLRQRLLALVRQGQHCLEAHDSMLAVIDPDRALVIGSATPEVLGEMLASIHSVLTVLGMPAPAWQELACGDIARLLIVLELQLEDEVDALANGYELQAEQHTGYCQLSVRSAGRRLRSICAERIGEVLGQLDDRISDPVDKTREDILSVALAEAGCLRLLHAVLPGVFEPDARDGIPIQTSQIQAVIMVRRELASAQVADCDRSQSNALNEVLGRLFQRIRESLQGAASDTGLHDQLMEDCRLYNARRCSLLRSSYAVPEAVTELSTCFQSELGTGLSRLRQEWQLLSNVPGLRYLCGWHCAWVSRLTTAALICGEVALHDLLGALRSFVLWLFERSEPLRQVDLMLFDEVCAAALTAETDAGFEALEVRLADARHAFELGAEGGSGIVSLHTPGKELDGARGVQTEVALGHVPVYLAQNIRYLLTACEDIQVCARTEFAALNRRLLVELRMLVTGARVLRVYRVEALSSVLADVHQLLGRQQDETVDQSSAHLLTEAHMRLRHSLNCAAAHQEVPDSRDLIARLYQWLEAPAGVPVCNDRTCGKTPSANQVSMTDEPALAACFQREAVELMERIEQRAMSLLPCEAPIDGDIAAQCPDLLSLLHTLKGNALQFDCPRMAELCHDFEQLLLRKSTRNDTFAEDGFSDAEPDVASSAVLECVQQLRAAVDELGGNLALMVPLPAGVEHSLPVPAQAMVRIAGLAEQTRSYNRAMLDVLSGFEVNESNAPRLLLLRDLLDEQRRHAIQLGEEIAGSRSIRFERLTSRLQRLAARHANLLDRQVRLQVQGGQMQIDRLLLERLVAPLEHLLRNAIDHGIEALEERRVASKPDCGNITLTIFGEERPEVEAAQQQRALRIELADDGRGIDINDSLTSGSGNGEQEQRLQRIFESGFSTRKQVTTRSGHGLGLAAVREAIVALGGSIRVSSRPGAGTCFHIALPV